MPVADLTSISRGYQGRNPCLVRESPNRSTAGPEQLLLATAFLSCADSDRRSGAAGCFATGPRCRSTSRDPGNLGAGSPIGWRVRNAPEARSGVCELHGNFSRPHQILLHVDHPTLLLFPAGNILHEQPLLRRYQARQRHKRTVRADIQRLCPFGKLWPLIWGSLNDNGNAQRNPLAASPPQPSFSISGLLIGHGELPSRWQTAFSGSTPGVSRPPLVGFQSGGETRLGSVLVKVKNL